MGSTSVHARPHHAYTTRDVHTQKQTHTHTHTPSAEEDEDEDEDEDETDSQPVASTGSDVVTASDSDSDKTAQDDDEEEADEQQATATATDGKRTVQISGQDLEQLDEATRQTVMDAVADKLGANVQMQSNTDEQEPRPAQVSRLPIPPCFCTQNARHCI